MEKDWKTFWDVASPQSASETMLELFGAAACFAAIDCIETAKADGRRADIRFWKHALKQIESMQKKRRKAALAQWKAEGLWFI